MLGRSHELVILVDAKAVLGAATKGRTSASGIRGVMRHIDALLLASNCLLKLVYVPQSITQPMHLRVESESSPSGNPCEKSRLHSS